MLSVAPEVKTNSFSLPPISAAICSRARSTASSAFHPNEWLREAALPNSVVRYGIIASSTRGSSGVVALLSM